MTPDDHREIRAWWLGRLADRLFAAACRRRGLDPYFAILAPLDAITGTPITKTEELSR
jgi:hypothetical protein